MQSVSIFIVTMADLSNSFSDSLSEDDLMFQEEQLKLQLKLSKIKQKRKAKKKSGI